MPTRMTSTPSTHQPAQPGVINMIVRHRSPFVSRSYPLVRTFDSSFDRAFEQLTQSFFEPRRRARSSRRELGRRVAGPHRRPPGVPSEAVTVNVAGRALTIGVDTDELQWERTVQLGTSVDPDKVSARHVDGRLTVTVGAVDAPEVRTIDDRHHPGGRRHRVRRRRVGRRRPISRRTPARPAERAARPGRESTARGRATGAPQRRGASPLTSTAPTRRGGH